MKIKSAPTLIRIVRDMTGSLFFFMLLSTSGLGSDMDYASCNAPSISGGGTSCSSSATLSASSSVDCNYISEQRWYYSASYSSFNSSITSVQPYCGLVVSSITVSSSTSYWVSTLMYNKLPDGSKGTLYCESSRTLASISFNSSPPTVSATVVANQNACEPSTPIIVASGGSSGSVYDWFETQYASVPVYTGGQFRPTLNYSDTDNGTKTYWLGGRVTNSSGCQSTINPRIEVTVQVREKPPQPSITEDYSFCPGSLTLSITNPVAGNNYIWYDVNYVQLGTGSNFSTGVLSTTSTFYTRTEKNGCYSSYASGQATIYPTFSAPVTTSASSSCSSPNEVTLEASTNYVTMNPIPDVTHRWYTSSTGPGYVTANEVEITTGLVKSHLTISESDEYWVSAIDVNGCESPRSYVSGSVADTNPPHITTAVVANQNACEPSNPIIVASGGSSGSVYEWFEIQYDGVRVFTGAQFQPTLNYSDTDSGTKTYWLGGTVTNSSGCQSTINPRIEVTVQVREKPSPPIASVDVTLYCAGSVTLSVQTEVNTTYKWYNSTGTFLANGSSYITPVLNSATFFEVEAIKDGCTSSRENIQINYVNIETYDLQIAASRCVPQTEIDVRLTGSQTGTSYQLYRNGTTVGSAKNGTGNGLNWNGISEAGNYSVNALKDDCILAMNNAVELPTEVNMFNIYGREDRCNNEVEVLLLESEQDVNYQLQKEGTNEGSAVSGTGNPITWSGLDPAFTYQVVANKGFCDVLMVGNSKTEVNFPSLVEQWSWMDFVADKTVGGGGEVILRIEDNILSLSLQAGFGLSALETGQIKLINTPFAIADRKIGELFEGKYEIKIENNWIVINGSGQVTAFDHNFESYLLVTPCRNSTFKRYSPTVALQNTVDILNGTVDSVGQITKVYNGGGVTIQEVVKQVSPSQKSLINTFETNELGQVKRSYLPYTSSVEKDYYPNNKIEQESFYNNINTSIPIDTKPYVEVPHEKSPLNRVLKQGAPGESWQPNPDPSVITDKVIHYSYEVNTLADEIFIWDIDLSTNDLTATGHYPNGQLTKTVTTDEEGHAVIEFVDKLGQTVLKRVQAHENGAATEAWADTYYVYDDFGNLRYVLPPEAVEEIGSSSLPYTPSPTLLARWAFQYKYDGRRRMVEKKVPGADWVYMVYDNRDRLVLSQDGNQRDQTVTTGKAWLFTKYDALNRPIATGIYEHPTVVNQAAMQTVVNGHYNGASSESWYEDFTGTGSHHGYTNRSYPVSITTMDYHTVTYYDNYDFRDNLTEFGSTFSYEKPSHRAGGITTPQGTYDYAPSAFETVKGQVTGSQTKVLGTNAWVKTTVYYDDRYRVIQSVTENTYHGTTERVSQLYNFPGWLLETFKEQSRSSSELALRNRYTYDHAGRLMAGYHELYENGVGQGEVFLAENKYNELGELIEKNLHVENGTPRQSIDYRYNIRGWLESVNNSTLLPAMNNEDTGQPQDLFGMELLYNHPLNGVSPGN